MAAASGQRTPGAGEHAGQARVQVQPQLVQRGPGAGFAPCCTTCRTSAGLQAALACVHCQRTQAQPPCGQLGCLLPCSGHCRCLRVGPQPYSALQGPMHVAAQPWRVPCMSLPSRPAGRAAGPADTGRPYSSKRQRSPMPRCARGVSQHAICDCCGRASLSRSPCGGRTSRQGGRQGRVRNAEEGHVGPGCGPRVRQRACRMAHVRPAHDSTHRSGFWGPAAA